MNRLRTTMILAGLLTAWTTSVLAVPAAVPYVGYLSHEDGGPFDGTATVVFALFEQEEGGVAVWGPHEFADAPVEQGRVAVVLGGEETPTLDSSLLSAPALWLEVQVNGTLLEPRQQVLSVPYALLAGDAERLGGEPAASFVTDAELPDLSAYLRADGTIALTGDLDAGGHRLLNVAVDASDTAPVAPTAGQFWWDAGGDLLAVWTGAEWLELGGEAPSAAAASVAYDLECAACVDATELAPEVHELFGYSDADAVAACDLAGFMRAGDVIAPEQLPSGGISQVSGGALSNTFTAHYSATPVAPDNVIAGLGDEPGTWSLAVPDLGTATSVRVSVGLTHPDVGDLTIWLVPPEPLGERVLLHEHGSAGFGALTVSYPPAVPVSGALESFHGTNIAGTWALEILDDREPAVDGVLNSWAIAFEYTTDRVVRVAGDVSVTGAMATELVAGELIDTLEGGPRAVYLDASSGAVLLASATNLAATRSFVGFAIAGQRVEPNRAVLVQTNGVLPGFGGLETSSVHYLSDLPGGVSGTPGSLRRAVGVAVSDVALLVVPDLTTQGAARTFVGEIGTTETGLLEESATFVEEIDVGFVPSYIEAVVHVGMVIGSTWSENDQRQSVQVTAMLRGDPRGDLAYVKTSLKTNVPPRELGEVSPWGAGALAGIASGGKPSFGEIAVDALGQLVRDNESGSILGLTSLELVDSTLRFTFEFDPGDNSAGIRYGVHAIQARE